MQNVADHTFSVLGVLEELDKFLALLECAYPNLRGILKLYQKVETHANEGAIYIF